MTYRWAAYVVLGVSFFEQLAWVPLLVYLGAALGSPEVVVLAASAYSLANAGGNVVAGRLADRVGRRPVAVAGLIAAAVTGVWHLATATPGALVAVRLVHGLAASLVAPATFALVGDSAASGQRGSAMARSGVAIGLASMVAPPVMGVLADRAGLAGAVMALAALQITTALVAGLRLPLRLPDPAPAPASAGTHAAAAPPVADRNAMLRVAVVVGIFLMCGQNVLFSSGTVQARELGLSPGQLGRIFSAFSVGALGVFLSPLARASDRWGRRWPLVGGLGAIAAAQGALATVPGAGGMAAMLLVYGVGFGLAFPAITALAGDAATAGRRGRAYGWLAAGFSAGAVIGPQLVRALSGVVPAFAVAAAASGLGLILAIVLWPQALIRHSAPA